MSTEAVAADVPCMERYRSRGGCLKGVPHGSVGAPGGVAGVGAGGIGAGGAGVGLGAVPCVVTDRGAEGTPGPAPFTARRLTSYGVPEVRPAIVIGDLLSAGDNATQPPPFSEYS